jgi:glycosyltransferase involved in cell wall biosynthesis
VFSKKDIEDIELEKRDELLIAHIQIKNVGLMLCEFGTTAVQLTNVSKRTGIPLIAIFYGYDAWHQEVLIKNKESYPELFSVAKKIIGVSQDICLQLEKLGCPKSKIIYLPCYVDLDLFKPQGNHTKENIFLSIGRFAETKSPHLTILAFNEVLKSVPDAQLRMIGKDGGGELFEACHILVKALGIEDKVHFLGIRSSEEVAKEMQAAKVFVQHSLTTPLHGDKEGTPVAIMEAMASGLPIVATRHAGIAEVIEDGVSGILVEEYDYIKMATKMTLLCKDMALCLKIGKEASARIRANDLVKNHIKLLSEIIEKARIESV